MTGLEVWFERWSTGVIGIAEWQRGERVLIHDTDTIKEIEDKLRFIGA